MPSPNPTTTRDYKGAAKATTLSAQIVNGTDTTFTVVDATGWPDGSAGKFVATVNAGLTDEEKILCLSRSGTTITKDTRGFDGTTAAGHAAGATVIHSLSAFDAAEWNAHTAATSGVHGHTGAAVGTTDTQVLTNKTLTAPVIATISNTGTVTLPTSTDTLVGRATTDTLTNKTLTSPTINTPTVTNPTVSTGTYTSPTVNGGTLDAASTIGGVSGTSLAADRTAWTTYTPTFVNCTSPVGIFAYKLIGKTLALRAQFTAGTATATTTVVFSLPAGLTAAATQHALAPSNLANGFTDWVANSGSSNFATVAAITAGAQLSTAAGNFNAVIEVA